MAQHVTLPVADGFALWDAISGDALPEVRIPRAPSEETEYYRYNRN